MPPLASSAASAPSFRASTDPRATRAWRPLLGLLVLSAGASGAWAQSATATPYSTDTVSPALDRMSLSIGAFHAKPEVGAAIGNNGGSSYDTGTYDAGRKTLPRISGEFLLGRNHGISLEAFRYSQTYNDSFGGTYSQGPFSATAVGGANLDFNLDVARLGYRYWFGTGNTVFGVGAGIGYYRVELETTAYGGGAAQLGNLGFGNLNNYYTRRDSDDAIAPMLEVGVRHAFSPDLRVFFDGSGIHKGGGGVRGSIYNAQLGVEWFPVRNVGVTLAYAVTDVDLKRDDAGLQRARLKFQGPVVGVKARF